jgi:recombinational DNA repair ATPase RecF
MSKPITNVHLSGFRGATIDFDLEFDPSKDITMLFGENGSGKSTILDAIDVVCNETIGCLAGVSVGQYPSQYLRTLGSQPASLQVAVHSHGESWTGTMQGNAITVSGPDGKPTVKILRRSRILDLVTARPGKRYEELRRFIDVTVVEKSEDALRTKLVSTNDTIAQLQRTATDNLENLGAFWEAEARPGQEQSAMEWARNRVNTGITELTEQFELLNTLVTNCDELKTAKEDYEQKAESSAQTEQQVQAIDVQIAAAPDVTATSVSGLLQPLQGIKTYIETTLEINECPTCKRTIDRDSLLSTVNAQISDLATQPAIASLQALTARKTSLQPSVVAAQTRLGDAENALVEALDVVRRYPAGNTPEIIRQLRIDWDPLTASPLGTNALCAICDRLETVRPILSNQRDRLQREMNQFALIEQTWRRVTEAEEKTTEQQRIRDGLQRVYELVHRKRVSFTQGILDTISQEADRLFKEIHPGEDIGLASLKMQETRRGSVDQDGHFNGNTAPPQAVFSESHIDTLGFCIWLALAKHERPSNTVLLVDDIFSSVDATHLGRIIDLLLEEAPNFHQVIIATHYRLWWSRIQSSRNIQRIELGQWYAATGIAFEYTPSTMDRLSEALEAPVLDRQLVASKAGILLENIFDDLTVLYERPLPRNSHNQYALAALITGCERLFSRYSLSVQIDQAWDVVGQPDNWQAIDCETPFNRIKDLRLIRNQVGGHFSPAGMEIPDCEIKEFGRAAIELAKALTCPSCRMIPNKIANDRTHRRCSCAKRAVRMTPATIH